MRLLPSAKVCFLGGCPRSGRNQDLFRSIAKQKTAVPQGAASLSLAVLESDGRKGKGAATNSVDCGVVGRLGENSRTQRSFGLSHDWWSVRRRLRTRGNVRLACRQLVATQGIAERGERAGAPGNLEAVPKKMRGRKRANLPKQVRIAT